MERARPAGNPRMLLWALSMLAAARLAAGDVTAALRARRGRGGAGRARGLPRGGPARLVPRRRAHGGGAAGNPDRRRP